MIRNRKNIFCSVLALLAMTSANAVWSEVVSTVYNDVIGSSGRGNIDLFAPKFTSTVIDGTVLEAFRQNNFESLVFAVDVNENAAGSETASSQGVAIDSLILTVDFSGSQQQFTSYYTPTKSLLTQKQGGNRSEHYTLIGTAGSNRITPNQDSEINNSSFDSIITVPINVDLTNATGATLEIVLMDTKVSLGDPETFYDYSNGFEEVALVSREDAIYLEHLRAGQNLAPLVISEIPTLNWICYPSCNSYFMAAYEDLYPKKGDYDFNDLVVGYQIAFGLAPDGTVANIRGSGYLIARGAEYDHDWYLHIELPAWVDGSVSHSVFAADTDVPMSGYPEVTPLAGSLDVAIYKNIASIYDDNGSTYVNTFADSTFVPGPRFEFNIPLNVGVPANQIMAAPFDPYLYVHETNYEIHRVDLPPRLPASSNTLEADTDFRDDAGFPFALVLPENWQPPLAGLDMGLAYPDFMTYVSTETAEKPGWYGSPAQHNVWGMSKQQWQW